VESERVDPCRIWDDRSRLSDGKRKVTKDMRQRTKRASDEWRDFPTDRVTLNGNCATPTDDFLELL